MSHSVAEEGLDVAERRVRSISGRDSGTSCFRDICRSGRSTTSPSTRTGSNSNASDYCRLRRVTDTDATTMLHMPSTGLLVAGDVVYNGVRIASTDPFDRVIVAQALRRNLTFITRDAKIIDAAIPPTLTA